MSNHFKINYGSSDDDEPSTKTKFSDENDEYEEEKQKKIHKFSSNYALYGDISDRIVRVCIIISILLG